MADGFSITDVGSFPAGGAVSAVRIRDFVGPLFTCASPWPALSLTSVTRPVDMIGTTTIAVYHNRAVSGTDAGAPID